MYVHLLSKLYIQSVKSCHGCCSKTALKCSAAMHSAAIQGVRKSAATMLWDIPSLTNQLLLVSDPKKRGQVPPNWQWPPTGMNIGPSLVQWQGRECDCDRQVCQGLPPPLGLAYNMCLSTRWRGQRRTVGTKEFPSCQSLLIPKGAHTFFFILTQ